MGQYRIKSEPLGVDFMVQGDQAPNAKSTFQILKQVVSPDKMIKAYEGGHKQLAREAFKNGYFDQEQDSDLYDVFKQAAGEVLEGLEGISKEVSLDFAASGMMTYGVPGSQQMVEEAREEQQKRRKKRKATGYQLAAEVFAGYKTIGDAGKLGFSKLVGEGDEDIDASIEFIKGMMETEAFLNDGASIMAEQFGDFDMYNDLKAGRVSPDKKQALAGSLFVQLENPLAMASTGAVRSTSNMLRRGTAKKLAEQLQKAEAKKLLYSQQLNRLSANAPDNVVQSATDALKGATKEADEILEKLKPYTEQKAKAGAGFTNKAIGKTMQGLGKAGEYVGNMTEFLRRAGIEEATTILMRAGLSENIAKGVVFGTVGAGLDATDGEMSWGGSGLNALAAYMGPRALATMGRSTAILGKQLTIAESSLPFFKRVGALPADNPKLSEVIIDRTENLVIGDAASQLKPILTQSREIPSLVRGTARVLDRSGVGRVLTEGANLTKATVAGASIPGAFGYMAGGEEGAASAIGASAPFIAAGLGYGSLLRFSSNSDLIAKQLGDLEYHKQSMTEPELREFKKLKKDQQIAISTFSQFFPDVVIRVKSMGKDGPNGAQYVDGKDSVVEINSDSDNPLGVVLAHEIGHHIERHGLLPNILEELIGNAEKGRVGLFTKIDEKTGKPIVQTDANGLKFYELNQEFRDLQQAYIEKLERTNVSDKDRLRYETPEHFAREIFAEIVAERMISGKTAKRARQSTTYKMIESLGERITSGGFKRKVMHSLGMATNKDGSIVKGTGVLNKAFRSSRELDNLVKRYEDETIGLSESEIREQRPVVGDDELDTVIVSPNDPIESLQAFNNGGHFKTNEDGSIKINPITRKPEVFTPAETRQANQALARDLIDAIQARENDLPEGHVTLSETADGKLVGSGKFIDDSIIDELAKTGRYNASQISYLREASRAGREGQGNHMLLFYYAATGKGGRKYKTLKGGYRDSLVYGVTITKDGNVIFDTVSLDKLQKNVDYLLKRRGKEIAQAFGGSDDATVRQNFESMFEKYLDNHAKGIINGDSNPESGITDKQRDFLNAAFGPVSKSQIADNPTLSNLGERRANTLATYRSRRLDRIGTIQPTGNTRNVVIDRLRRNLMPGRGDSDKLFMPTEIQEGSPGSFFRPKSSRDKSARLRTFKSPVYLKDGSRLSGVADNPEQNPFYGYDKNGQEFSQRREYVNPQDITKSRDSDRTANQIRNELESGQKLFHPAYHGTPHTLAPEAGAPLGRFRTSAIGTGEGSQAYGHGLYFAGKRDVAEHYRKVLSGKKDDISQDYDGKPFDRTNPKHEAARRLNKEAKMLGVSKNQVRPRVIDQIKGQLQRRDLDRSLKERLSDVSKVLENKQEAKTNEGSLYKVELAPKENEYLLWDKPLSEQPKGVKESIKQVYLGKELPEPYQTQISYPGMKSFIGQDLPSTPKQEAVLTLLGEKGNKLSAAEILKNDSKALEALAGIEYSKIKETPHGQVLGLHIYNDLKFGSNPIAASTALKEAGIPGIKYLDGSSRNQATFKITPPSQTVSGKYMVKGDDYNSKGKHFDTKAEAEKYLQEQLDKLDYNYVIFDEADVTVTEKLFMPASEAGAGKGKQAEAAKLWNEKGTDSPYFKKWFDKSKVVDENGEPLVVYHGTPGKLEGNFFDPNRLGSSTGAKDAKKGFYFSDSPLTAQAYMGENYKYTPQEGQRLRQLTKRNEELQSELKNIRSTYSSPSDAVLASRQLRNEYSQNLAEMRSIDDNVKTQKSGTSLDVYLSMKNPLSFDFKRNPYDEATQSRIISEALNNGNDGVIFKNMMDDPEGGRVSDIYVAFSPEQIKSATGNRGTFDAGERNILFMPASEAKNLKSGDMLTLDDKSLKLFLPSPGNPNASLSEFNGKNVQVLTTDLSMVGDKKIDGATVAFTGGPGYLSVNDAWGFTNESSAKGFRTRWEREGRPLIGLTSMKQDNHKASTLTREYYVRKFMQAINQGKIAESLVNEHIIEALTRVAKGKGLTDSQKRALLSVKNIEDFLRIFSNGQIIPWKATPKIYDRLSQATLPIKQGKLKELGLDLDTILRETRQKEYNDIKKGSLLAIAEYDGSDAVYRPDLNSAYPWSIPLKEKAFLKDFADIQDLSSRQDLRGSDGDANMAVAMGAGVMLDKLGRGDVNFMPSGRPTRQPANRITRQAPAMPGNRFMLPAVSAGAKSAERFR